MARFFGVESTCDELLRVIGVAVLNLLGQSLLFLLSSHVEDRELSLLACWASLAHRDILLCLRDGHMSDSLSIG